MASGEPGVPRQRNIEALSAARRIYVATVRRDGNQSTAAPVWFTLGFDGSILIETRATSWIAKRVSRDSRVIVWIGGRQGPALMGTAKVTRDRKPTKRIVEDYPRRYWLARLGFHRPTQARFDSGKIFAIEITALDDLPQGFCSEPGAPAPNPRSALQTHISAGD